ncbi:DUF3152 domain-containing protein [Micromonospora sp. CPCC 205371]|nr:DUF3152 domain-containing protein [Micromonospora sp. CPCC 205371]
MNATRAVFLAAAGVILTGLALPKLAGDTDRAPVSVTPTSAATPASATTAPPAPTLTPTPPAQAPPPADPITLPGPVPSRGEGAFQYGTTGGPVFGRSGTVHRYRVAVERGSNEDVAQFAVAVDAALGDQRSWIAGGHRMQRVPDGQAHEFTVYLATGETAQRMCAAGGVNIQVAGRPYTSCRTSGRVIVNLDRWRLSIPDYTSAKVPLSVYRSYVVNHEVGHQLGHRHELCPRAGRPAPVMAQQTLGLGGCVANPWPYLNGRRYAGPLK